MLFVIHAGIITAVVHVVIVRNPAKYFQNEYTIVQNAQRQEWSSLGNVNVRISVFTVL